MKGVAFNRDSATKCKKPALATKQGTDACVSQNTCRPGHTYSPCHGPDVHGHVLPSDSGTQWTLCSWFSTRWLRTASLRARANGAHTRGGGGTPGKSAPGRGSSHGRARLAHPSSSRRGGSEARTAEGSGQLLSSPEATVGTFTPGVKTQGGSEQSGTV